MITVNTKQLASAIAEADVFKLPNMNEGMEYLYNSIYSKLSHSSEVRLSDIDFNAFGQDDIDSLNSLHSDVFEKNYYTADSIMSTLRNTVPICKSVGYI